MASRFTVELSGFSVIQVAVRCQMIGSRLLSSNPEGTGLVSTEV